jgi:Fe-S cluster biogenesis protein NfuA
MLVESEIAKQLPSGDDERTAIIKAVIEEVRPNLQRDGGDCQLIEIDGNKIMVKLTGACVFCKLSSATLEGIQSKVVERLGELVRIIPVAGAAKINPVAGAVKVSPVAGAPKVSPVAGAANARH